VILIFVKLINSFTFNKVSRIYVIKSPTLKCPLCFFRCLWM